MNIVSFGGGTNSTAMIIGMYLHKIPIDLILFADTGGEQPHTYKFIEIFNGWLEKHGLPQIISVQYHDKDGNRLTLEQECINSGTLPSIAYGFKRCSLKHKISTQEKFCNNYQPSPTAMDAAGLARHLRKDATSTRSLLLCQKVAYLAGGYWKSEPGMDRMVDGLPNWMDRVRCLGNAVCPPQFFPFFQQIRLIEEAEHEPTTRAADGAGSDPAAGVRQTERNGTQG